MGTFLLRRLGLTVLAVWGALSAVFVILHATGDPALLMAPAGAPPEQIAALSHALGYDRPVLLQYLSFFGEALHGQFPDSLQFQRPALDVVLERLPATLLLAAVSLAIAVPPGHSSSAWPPDRPGRMAPGGSGRCGWSTWCRPCPTSTSACCWCGGSGSSQAGFPPRALASRPAWCCRRSRSPSVCCPASPGCSAPACARSLARPYARTATALGASRARVRWHAAYGSLPPTITVFGLEAGALLGGAVIVETVFSWPGVGQLAVSALQNEDYPLVLADLSFLILTFVLINLVVNLLYGVLDPRVRHPK